MVTTKVTFCIPLFLTNSEVSTKDIAQWILQSFSGMQIVAWFALLHLSFYNISFRIKSLSSFVIVSLKSEKKNEIQKCFLQHSIIDRKTSRKHKSQLQICGYLFNQLSAVFSLLNNIFSLPILLIFTTLMISSITNVYFILYDILLEQSILHFAIPIFVLTLTFNVCLMLIILNVADLPLLEVGLIFIRKFLKF